MVFTFSSQLSCQKRWCGKADSELAERIGRMRKVGAASNGSHSPTHVPGIAIFDDACLKCAHGLPGPPRRHDGHLPLRSSFDTAHAVVDNLA